MNYIARGIFSSFTSQETGTKVFVLYICNSKTITRCKAPKKSFHPDITYYRIDIKLFLSFYYILLIYCLSFPKPDAQVIAKHAWL